MLLLWPKVPKLFASKPLVLPKLFVPKLFCPIVCFFSCFAEAPSAEAPSLLFVALSACRLSSYNSVLGSSCLAPFGLSLSLQALFSTCSWHH